MATSMKLYYDKRLNDPPYYIQHGFRNGKKNENEKYFNSLNLCQKLHPELKMEQLLDCIDIIIWLIIILNK